MLENQIARDTALLLMRIVLGTVFIAHGWQKMFVQKLGGEDGVIADFAHQGIPQPELSAWLASGMELVGGALLVVGLLAPLVAGLFMLQMVAVIYLVHWPHGLFASNGGIELPLVLCAGLLGIVVFGSGRASLDNAFSRFG